MFCSIQSMTIAWNAPRTPNAQKELPIVAKKFSRFGGKKKVTNIEKFIKDHKNEGFTHESGIVRRLDDFETLLNCGFCPVVNVCRLHEDMSYPTAENCIVTFMKWGAEEIEE